MTKMGAAAGAAWALALLLIIGAWAVALQGGEEHWQVAVMLAFTGCVTTGLAVTLHVRTYVCRLSRLIRVSAGLERGDPAELHPVP